MNIPGTTHSPPGMTHSPKSTSAQTDELKTQTQTQDATTKQDVTTAQAVTSTSSSPTTQSTEHTRRSARVTARPFRRDPAAYATAALDEPLTYKQAFASADSHKWQAAMRNELDAHVKTIPGHVCHAHLTCTSSARSGSTRSSATQTETQASTRRA